MRTGRDGDRGAKIEIGAIDVAVAAAVGPVGRGARCEPDEVECQAVREQLGPGRQGWRITTGVGLESQLDPFDLSKMLGNRLRSRSLAACKQ